MIESALAAGQGEQGLNELFLLVFCCEDVAAGCA